MELHRESFRAGGSEGTHVSMSAIGHVFTLLAETGHRATSCTSHSHFSCLLTSHLLTFEWLEQVTWLSPTLRAGESAPPTRGHCEAGGMLLRNEELGPTIRSRQDEGPFANRGALAALITFILTCPRVRVPHIPRKDPHLAKKQKPHSVPGSQKCSFGMGKAKAPDSLCQAPEGQLQDWPGCWVCTGTVDQSGALGRAWAGEGSVLSEKLLGTER